MRNNGLFRSLVTRCSTRNTAAVVKIDAYNDFNLFWFRNDALCEAFGGDAEKLYKAQERGLVLQLRCTGWMVREKRVGG